MAWYWCWTEKKWECPKEPNEQIYAEAWLKFHSGWEYARGATGQWDEEKKLYKTDCWYLVTDTLKKKREKKRGQIGSWLKWNMVLGPTRFLDSQEAIL